MKFSEKWLREWVAPKLSTAELCEQLTMAGLEVDTSHPVAGEFSGVIVAHVLEVNPHPNADRLNLCTIEYAKGKTIEIVCGASNVRPDMKVAFAQLDAILPGNFKIKKAKIRGVESQGMLCSAKELGMAEESGGILSLAADAPIGKDFREYLALDDTAIDIDLTPNRSDCLSISGIAREVSALNNIDIKAPKIKLIKAKTKDSLPIHVTAKEACPRYIGRVISNVDARAETPLWLHERLRRSSLKSINVVVDITNYVMLELGQPMHAFDLQSLSKQIEVRHAKKGEKIALLDGQTVTLDAKTLVIADAEEVLAIAGVMGGESSGFIKESSNVFLESAFFTPELLAGCARRYGLHTDSSHRFERGVDPTLQSQAIERATVLILEICGGEAGPICEEKTEKYLPKQHSIILRRERLTKVLGVEIADKEVSAILNRLSLQPKSVKKGWQVLTPTHRFDLEQEIDLIEEIARVYGYQQLPTHQPSVHLMAHESSESDIPLAVFRQTLINRGFHEAITYSFIAPKLVTLFTPQQSGLSLKNPLSEELSVMRTSLLPGLAQAAAHNLKRQQPRVRLFETGLCFTQDRGELEQRNMLAGIIAGNVLPEQWGEQKRNVDFYDLKGDVEALLAHGNGQRVSYLQTDHSAFHPGKSARMMRDMVCVGHLGTLHPQLAQQLDLPASTCLFELEISNINNRLLSKFNGISKFPAVRRDLAFVVDQDVSADEMMTKIVSEGTELLKHAKIFDIYQGEGVDLGRKSVAIGLTFQDPARTLVDDEINQIVDHATSVLKTQFNAILRD